MVNSYGYVGAILDRNWNFRNPASLGFYTTNRDTEIFGTESEDENLDDLVRDEMFVLGWTGQAALRDWERAFSVQEMEPAVRRTEGLRAFVEGREPHVYEGEDLRDWNLEGYHGYHRPGSTSDQESESSDEDSEISEDEDSVEELMEAEPQDGVRIRVVETGDLDEALELVDRIIETMGRIPSEEIPEDIRQLVRNLSADISTTMVIEMIMTPDGGTGAESMSTDVEDDHEGIWTSDDEDRVQKPYTNSFGREKWPVFLNFGRDTNINSVRAYANQTNPILREMMYIARVRYNRIPNLVNPHEDLEAQLRELQPLLSQSRRIMDGSRELFDDTMFDVWRAFADIVPTARRRRMEQAAETHRCIVREAVAAMRRILPYEREYLFGLVRVMNGGSGGPLIREHGVQGLQYNPETEINEEITSGPYARFPEFHRVIARETDTQRRHDMWEAHFALREFGHFHGGDLWNTTAEERGWVREQIRVERALPLVAIPNLADIDWLRYSE